MLSVVVKDWVFFQNPDSWFGVDGLTLRKCLDTKFDISNRQGEFWFCTL